MTDGNGSPAVDDETKSKQSAATTHTDNHRLSVNRQGAAAELESRPEFMRTQLRRVEIAPVSTPLTRELRQPEFANVSLRRVSEVARRRSVNARPPKDDSMLKVELLPGTGGGQNIMVTGYGQAPNVAPVFAEGDGGDDDDLDDDVMEAADIEQIELNIQAEVGGNSLNIDLSAEYQKPRLDRALVYRRLMMPTKTDGDLWPIIGTRTGKFIPRKLERCDPFCEGRKSDFIVYGPGVSGYFKWLKAVGGIFLFLCVVHIPSIVLNTDGGTYFSNHPLPFAQTTLGNLYVPPAPNATR